MLMPCVSLDILCILGAPSIAKPLFKPNPNLKVQYIEITYHNDKFSKVAISHETNKYTLLHPTRMGGPPTTIVKALQIQTYAKHTPKYAVRGNCTSSKAIASQR